MTSFLVTRALEYRVPRSAHASYSRTNTCIASVYFLRATRGRHRTAAQTHECDAAERQDDGNDDGNDAHGRSWRRVLRACYM